MIEALIARAALAGITLSVKAGTLYLSGSRSPDPALKADLVAHKAALLESPASGSYYATRPALSLRVVTAPMPLMVKISPIAIPPVLSLNYPCFHPASRKPPLFFRPKWDKFFPPVPGPAAAAGKPQGSAPPVQINLSTYC
jgi:hypothetical protein